MFEEGDGVPSNLANASSLYEKALRLFRDECSETNARGCTALGLMFADGYGVEQDHERAADLFQRACEWGDPTGCSFFEKLTNEN